MNQSKARLIAFSCLLTWDTLIAAPKHEQSQEITVQYEKRQRDTDEFTFHSGIERIFQNPILASGLNSGSEAINRSIESIMEAVFYSLLDRQLEYQAVPNTKMFAGLNRDVFSTAKGQYVILDRFRLGPEYNEQLANIEGLSLDLNISANASIYHIYLRTDAIRLAEQTDLHWFRGLVNNWFGALPLLSAILPPSFNPNEMYDPIKLVSTPIIFPSKPELFYKMRKGSILSYAMNQGVRLPLDVAAAFGEDIAKWVKQIEGFDFRFPLSIFANGEHRINVLRRDEHVAWVGLSLSSKTGASLTTDVGKVAHFFSSALSYWDGLRIPVFPVSLEMNVAKYDTDELLYEFDLRQESARLAYTKAVKGDFTEAHRLYNESKAGKLKHGVHFHFNKLAQGDQNQRNNTQNVILTRQSKLNHRSLAEVEILDDRGKLFVLEAQQNHENEYWDALLGVEQKAVQNQAELLVKKIFDKHGSQSDYKYVFEKTESDPMNLTLSLKLQDKYTDSEELEHYLNQLRKFADLPLESISQIPHKSPLRQKVRAEQVRFGNPNEQHFIPHTPPLYLGTFSATAAIYLNTKEIDHIINRPQNQMWKAFANAYGQDPNLWTTADLRKQHRFTTRWLNRLTLYPFRLLGFSSKDADFYAEASKSIQALENVREAQDPMKKVQAFYDLFSSDYPQASVQALLSLSRIQNVPRSISLFTKARGSASDDIRNSFQSLNGKIFRSRMAFKPPKRQRVAKEKLLAFVPSSIRQEGQRPELTSLTIRARELPESVVADLRSAAEKMAGQTEIKNTKHVYAKLQALNVRPQQPLKIYIRFSQGGKLQLGKFKLAEQVVTAPPAESIFDLAATTDLTKQTYELWLTGPLSPIKGLFFNEAISFGGDFDVYLAVSQDGISWSDENTIRFHFSDGVLSKQ